MNSHIEPTVKVGNAIEYYAPEALVGDHYNICKGMVTTILPNESLQVMTDVHFYVDGLIPITCKWFFSDNCDCIVGDDEGVPYAEFWVSFWILPKGPRKNSLHLISQRN
jgi:hypothetical protein